MFIVYSFGNSIICFCDKSWGVDVDWRQDMMQKRKCLQITYRCLYNSFLVAYFCFYLFTNESELLSVTKILNYIKDV